MIRYDPDHTLGHREYWRAILAEVRAESAANETSKPIEELTEDELEQMTRPTNS